MTVFETAEEFINAVKNKTIPLESIHVLLHADDHISLGGEGAESFMFDDNHIRSYDLLIALAREQGIHIMTEWG